MKRLIKIVLILLGSPSSQCTDVKTVFLCCGLIVNSGLKLVMKNTKQNTPPIHKFWINYLKTKHQVYSHFKEGKVYHAKTLEMYYVKTLEVYHAKTLEVYHVKNTRGVYCKNTRGVLLSKCSLEVISI